MERTLRKIALFTMFISLQTFGEDIPGNALLADQDIELMQKNPDLKFVSLDDNVRQAILEAAQIDMECPSILRDERGR